MSSDQSVDLRIAELYDDYCPGTIGHREFLRCSAAISIVGGFSAVTLAQAMLPRYAEAETISFTDERIKAVYMTYPAPGGASGTMRGNLVQPSGEGPHPAVIAIHENRGLNPYVEDLARRLGVTSFLALAPDALSPVGGYPGNDDHGRAMQAKLDPTKLSQDIVNSARYLKAHELSTGKLGAVGLCWGGGMVNHLAVTLSADLDAGVPFYGAAPATVDVPKIKAPLLIQYVENDPRINAMWPAFESALKANDIRYTMHMYEDTNHGFHNNSMPRYDEAAAKLAWDRTIEFFKAELKA